MNLLNRMLERVRDAGEPHVGSDIRQLLGLAEVMDRQGFLPIRDEELEHGPTFARRMLQLKDLVEPVIQQGRDEHWADTERLRTGIWRNGYGRYFRFSGLETIPWFGVYETLWAAPDADNTPLWVWLCRRDPAVDGLSLVQLDGLRERLGLRLHQDSDGYWAPIYLKPRADKDQLVAHIVAQLREIGEVLTISRPGQPKKLESPRNSGEKHLGEGDQRPSEGRASPRLRDEYSPFPQARCSAYMPRIRASLA